MSFYGLEGKQGVAENRNWQLPILSLLLGSAAFAQRQGVEFIIYSAVGDAQQRTEMTNRGGGRTVAQVIIDNRPLAGFDQLTAPVMDQELYAPLRAARQHYSATAG